MAAAMIAGLGGCVTPRQRHAAALRPAPDSGAIGAVGQTARETVAGPGKPGVAGAGDSAIAAARPESTATGSGGGAQPLTLADSGAAPVAPPDTTVVPPVAWDIEVEANAERARVTYFADVFTGRLREPFERALSRQTRYADLIGDRLRAAGLPQDLIYLALVESYYDPHAYSRAAAVGMWQFMTRTARAVGLRVDWWVDERRDPVRATEGAVRHLLSLHDEFGSPFLAAAAYNGGSGRVSRGLAQFAARLEEAEGEEKFFALSDARALRPETRDYVPKIIAAALVAKQPGRYGLRVDTLAPLAFDSVVVPGGTPLAAVALAALAQLDTVRDLNPHILRGMVPPGDAMWVRVPVGAATAFEERFVALDSADRTSLTRVKSRKGESMASIARKHGLTAKKLGWYNPRVARLKSGNLVAGQTILVPTVAVASAARDVPNPAIERYPRRARVRPVARTAASAARKPAPATPPRPAPAKQP
jgi:membrane-bound lytic murein transglycosylase D